MTATAVLADRDEALRPVPIAILIGLVALPQLSETVYSPSLPALADYFSTTAAAAESTMSVYLCGFAAGILLWGRASDRHGRRPVVLAGLLLYTMACVGCALAQSVLGLISLRFVQAVGASVGSVMGQAITREGFDDVQRPRVFATISMALAFAPAAGVGIGGVVSSLASWRTTFLALVALGALLLFWVGVALPETSRAGPRSVATLCDCLKRMLRDRRVLLCGFILSCINGIIFGYYAEAPFFFTESLGVPVDHYGLGSLGLALPLLTGAWLSRRLQKSLGSLGLVRLGAGVICVAAVALLLAVATAVVAPTSGRLGLLVAAALIAALFTGLTLVIPNVLCVALLNYKHCIGTAGSLFGFGYYTVVALWTQLVIHLHDGSVSALPLYLTCIALVMALSIARFGSSLRG